MNLLARMIWAPLTTVVNAAIFLLLWQWFLEVDPINFPPITYAHSVGFSVISVFLINMSAGTTVVMHQYSKEDLFKMSLIHCGALWILTIGIAGFARAFM